jgi:ubiquinone/menaquinone biosynthesis C-methylase UbiE
MEENREREDGKGPGKFCTGRHGRGRGPGSYHIFDQEVIFNEINLKPGEYVLDLGCGSGNYSMHAAEIVGDEGKVFSYDAQAYTINALKECISEEGIKNIIVGCQDITEPYPLPDDCIDVCIIITVLHTIDFIKRGMFLFNEIYRVLKPGGRLITVDCKKIATSYGPPLHMRISEEELIREISGYKFEMFKNKDLGDFYMLQFCKIV